jgi:hypothetical protein
LNQETLKFKGDLNEMRKEYETSLKNNKEIRNESAKLLNENKNLKPKLKTLTPK